MTHENIEPDTAPKMEKSPFRTLEAKVEEMDKYLNTLGAENTDLKERVEKLERLTDPESGK